MRDRREGVSASTGRPQAPSRGFACVAFALLALLVGANMPSPFYAGYARTFGFTPLVLTLIFATYVATLVPALCLAAPLADTLGYRRVLVPALILAAAAMVLFANARSAGWLFAARAVQGVAVGTASGTLTSALVTTEPNGDRHRASLLATLMTTAGNGIGPVLAGVAATYLPAPTRLCFLAEAGLLALAVLAVLRLPATVGVLGQPWRPRVPHVPAGARRRFRTAACVSLLAWAVTALCLTLVPSYLSAFTGNDDILLAGLAAGLILLAASVTQLLAAHTGTRAAQTGGLVALVVGLLGVLLAGLWGSVALVLIGSLIAGVGQGLAFMGAMRECNDTVTDTDRTGVVAAFYLVTYAGFGVPILGVGLLATTLGTATAVQAFVVVAAPLSLLLAGRVWFARR